MLKRMFTLGSMVLCGILSISCTSTALPETGKQADDKITLDLKDAPAAEICAALSQQLNRPVVLDGEVRRQKATLQLTVPRSTALTTIARLLDLEVREGKGGAVIFTQRFESEPRLPQARPAEINALAASVLRTLPNVSPDPDHEVWGAGVRRLAGTLNDAQRNALVGGGTLTLNDLGPDQREQLIRCVYGRFVGGPRYFYTLLSAVTSDAEKTIVKLAPKLRTLMIEPPSRSQMPRINLGIRFPEGSAAVKRDLASVPGQPAARQAAVPVAEGGQGDGLVKPLTLDGNPTTLKGLTAAIQAQAGVAVKHPAHLAERRLGVASTGQSVRAVLDAVCDAEGWSWSSSESGAVQIEGPATGVKRGETLYGAVRRLTPPDLVTYLGMPPVERTQVGGGSTGTLGKRRDEISPLLIAALSPLEDKLVGDGVKLSDLKAGADELLLLALMTSFRAESAVGELFANSTHFLVRPENSRLRVEKGTVLMIDCDLGEGRQEVSFGANTAGP